LQENSGGPPPGFFVLAIQKLGRRNKRAMTRESHAIQIEQERLLLKSANETVKVRPLTNRIHS
jgi:hypothetical protein